MPLTISRILGNFGVSISGEDVRYASDRTLRDILDQLLTHRIVVIKGQELSNDDYVAFGRRWGAPILLVGKMLRLGSHPEMIRQSNSPSVHPYSRNVASHWHCDSSYEEKSATTTMIYGVEAPEDGGETLFADTVAAYEALSDEEKATYEVMRVRHASIAAAPLPGETIPDPSTKPYEIRNNVVELAPVTKPLVARHPFTDRKAFYGLGGSCFEIEGKTREQSTEILLNLRRHATQDRFRSRYKLMPGDILLWDNFSVMHRATPIEYTDEPGRRRLNYRISVTGAPTFL